jgi:ABC-type histidine transport system ATPase subunit
MAVLFVNHIIIIIIIISNDISTYETVRSLSLLYKPEQGIIMVMDRKLNMLLKLDGYTEISCLEKCWKKSK